MWQLFTQKDIRQTCGELGVDPARGLTAAEASARLQKHGPNELAEKKRKSKLAMFLSQLNDPMIYILFAAAAISIFLREVSDAVIILLVVLLNAVIGMTQEAKAEQALEALKKLSSPNALVRRDGRLSEVPAAGLVPGDIVLLEAGRVVPADLRLLQSVNLKVEESALTGESVPAEKDAAFVAEGEPGIGDRVNMAFSSTSVAYGRGEGVVTATGMDTEIGRIAAMLAGQKQELTPLQKRLADLGKILGVVAVVVCLAMFGIAVLQRRDIPEMLLTAISLAVAAIPEGLPAVVTIVLALGVQRMVKVNTIVRRLPSVETLGAVSVVCSDKTGTLTQNKMTPQKIYADGALLAEPELNLANDVQRLLLKAALLASDATTDEERGTSIGDPTEVALVMMGDRIGVDEGVYRSQHPRLRELAFDSDRKLMSTLHVIEGVPTLYTKGAIDVLLDRSTHVLTGAGAVPLTPEWKERISRTNMELSLEGLRVLALAYKELPEVRDLTLDDERDFTFIGLVSMIDPPRPEAVQAVADAKRGGVRTIMITGDHKVTASAIARQIGIFREGDEAVSGVELDGMSDHDLDERLEHISVYARVSPEHKIRIVKAWQRKGKIVSMTGDGVNDAPALKAADIGVAMGITGTEVSKDAASMILADDNFATIVKAVVNGRGVYTNIKNAINFLLSGNMAGILCVFLASVLGLPMPFAPVHLLFINLLTDSLPAIAVGVEPARKGLLDQKPRNPKEPILNKSLMLRILAFGAVIAAATMTAFFVGLNAGGAALASTMAFA
ncbi:cation-translocating P-type ATPase, partial [Anaerotruncus massiliensis (ex Liu et al. 2021)]|uniref:cation-translocating P-type ATPase n=2 Tax=Anaerotruncus TaxID=244127 RepID=UPI003AF5A2E7